jgi:hypothetical protein
MVALVSCCLLEGPPGKLFAIVLGSGLQANSLCNALLFDLNYFMELIVVLVRLLFPVPSRAPAYRALAKRPPVR